MLHWHFRIVCFTCVLVVFLLHLVEGVVVCKPGRYFAKATNCSDTQICCGASNTSCCNRTTTIVQKNQTKGFSFLNNTVAPHSGINYPNNRTKYNNTSQGFLNRTTGKLNYGQILCITNYTSSYARNSTCNLPKKCCGQRNTSCCYPHETVRPNHKTSDITFAEALCIMAVIIVVGLIILTEKAYKKIFGNTRTSVGYSGLIE